MSFSEYATPPMAEATGVYNYNPTASSSGLTDLQTGPNLYLLSLLCPDIPAPIPDLDMTASITKQVRLTKNFAVAGTGSGMFLVPFHSDGQKIRFYGESGGVYRYISDIPLDQELSEDFFLTRFVSGYMEAKSASYTGTAFNVAGEFTCISFAELPPITVQTGSLQVPLSYERLSSYARNPECVVTSIDLPTGVHVNAHPTGQHRYQPQDTNVVSTEYYEVNVLNEFHGPTPNNGWLPDGTVITQGIDTSLYDSNLDPGFIIDDLWGDIEFDSMLNFQMSAVAGEGNLITRIYVEYVSADPVTYAEVITPTVVCIKAQHFTASAAGVTHVTVENHAFSADPRPIRRLTVIGTYVSLNGAPLGTVVTVAYTIADPLGPGFEACQSVGYHAITKGHKFDQSPGTIIAFDGLNVGQTLSLSGRWNYEAVPNFDLAKNVATTMDSSENPMDLEVAEHVMSLAPVLGIRFVWNRLEYDQVKNSGLFHRLSQRNSSMALSSGWSGFKNGLSKAWNFLKPVFKSIALPAASTVGLMLGNPAAGALIGQGLQSALSRGMTAYSSEYNSPGSLDMVVSILQSTKTIRRETLEKLASYDVNTMRFVAPLPIDLHLEHLEKGGRIRIVGQFVEWVGTMKSMCITDVYSTLSHMDRIIGLSKSEIESCVDMMGKPVTVSALLGNYILASPWNADTYICIHDENSVRMMNYLMTSDSSAVAAGELSHILKIPIHEVRRVLALLKCQGFVKILDAKKGDRYVVDASVCSELREKIGDEVEGSCCSTVAVSVTQQ
jgi:hypothetical protein